MEPHRFESVDQLKQFAGREAGVSEWLLITQERIDRFADLTEDRQWIHVDPARAAAESPFGATIAHGFLTVSLLTRMMHEAVPLRIPCKLLVNYGFNRLRFPSPVKSGSRIRAKVTLNSVTDVSGGLEVAWGVTVEIEDQAKPALAVEWLLRIYF